MYRGFSLVELSIVLVILGLLTGGILAGQSLIRASELRAVTTEYSRYVAAIQTFRDKYFAVPGDFKDATRFWTRQVAVAHCVTNSAAAVSTPGACDGNGDGIISAPAAANESGEMFMFWRHLALSGLVEGSYTGLAGPNGLTDATIGTNSPNSKLGSAGWSIRYILQSGNATFTDGLYNNAMVFGADNPAQYTFNKVLKPEEAWNVDTKMDDGRPQKGKVWGVQWDDCTTAANAADTNGDYALTDSAAQCGLAFMNSVN